MVARVLVVEDADAIRTAVGIALEVAGFAVLTRADGETLERDLADFQPDLVLLDVMLPGRDGFALLEVVRQASNAGIVLLTARDAVEDRLHGLRTGADDYVVKPFVLAELIARVEAVLRRMGRLRTVLEIGDLMIDVEASSVTTGRPADRADRDRAQAAHVPRRATRQGSRQDPTPHGRLGI